jgi:hypothetical protein
MGVHALISPHPLGHPRTRSRHPHLLLLVVVDAHAHLAREQQQPACRSFLTRIGPELWRNGSGTLYTTGLESSDNWRNTSSYPDTAVF